MKKERSTIEGTDPNLTGQPIITNQMQPKGIMQGSPGIMKTVIQYKNYIYSENPNEELKSSSGAIIRKQIDTVSSSEALNKYYVFLQSKNGLKLVFKSESPGDIYSKGSKMNIKHIRSKNEEITALCPVYARMDYSTTRFCCFCLPVPIPPRWKIIEEPHQNFIGVIKQLSKYGCEIYDDRKNELYKIVNFVILKNGQEVATIYKKNMSIGNNTPISENTYELSFPSGAAKESKIILIFATMLIDLKNLEHE